MLRICLCACAWGRRTFKANLILRSWSLIPRQHLFGINLYSSALDWFVQNEQRWLNKHLERSHNITLSHLQLCKTMCYSVLFVKVVLLLFSFSYGYQLFIKFCPDDAGSKDDESISYWYSYYLFCVLNLRLYNTDKSTRLLHFVEQETFNHWITPDVWAPAPAKSHCCTQIAYCVHHIENWICRFSV